VLEVSLRKAGYSVTTCADALTAIEMIGLSRPDMIISDTRLPDVDGFQLVERLRESEDSREIPFMFLSSDGSVESKVKGLELGVQDYLTKPIYIKEIITRVNLELQRRQRVGLERKSVETKTRFSGSLADMGLVDLLQTIDISRKSGVLHLTSPIGQRGAIYFDVGGLKHAELGKLRGEWALYRSLVWNEGNFELEFRPVRLEEETISMSTQGLLMEGMRRLDEWGRLLEQLPPLDAVFEIDEAELRDRLAEIPDEINDVLKYFDGVRSLMDVVDEVAKDDLETLAAISKLYFEGIVQPTGRIRTLRPPELQPGESAVEGGGSESDTDVVPVTTSAGDLSADDSARTVDRAVADEDRLTVPGHSSVAPPPMNPASIVPPPDLSGSHALSALAAELDTELEVERALGEQALGGGGNSGTGTAPARTPPYGLASPAPSNRRPQNTLMGPGFDAAKTTEKATVGNVTSSSAVASGNTAPSNAAPSTGGATQTGATHTNATATVSSASQKSEATPQTEAIDHRDEDGMSKKKRKNRGGSDDQRERRVESRIETTPEVAKKEETARTGEAAKSDESNVIQFPAKRSVTSVAVNDDVMESVSHARDDRRDDDTSSRLREDKSRDDKSREDRHADKKDSKPLPGELPRVRIDEDDDGLPKEIAAAPPDARERRDERRKKKNATTSSGEIRALGTGTGEHGIAAEEFFRAKQRESHAPADHDDFSDLKHVAEPLPPASLQARNATIGIILIFGAAIGSYWYYTNVHLPQPVELGHGRPASIPVVTAGSGSGTSGRAVEPPVEAVEPPIEAVEPPVEAVEPPVEAIEPPVEAIEPPVEAVEPPVEAVEPPVEAVEPPVAVAGDYDAALAEAEAARRRPATAIPLYERAIEINPNGTVALSQLSYLLINRGRGDDMRRAAEYAERASALDSTDSLAWLVLAVARETLGDRAGARAAYRACVDQGAPGRWQNECRPHAR
jgi:CheY-like chemotaxis protein